MFVLGRDCADGGDGGFAVGSDDHSGTREPVVATVDGGPVARFGRYRARDGSVGAPVGVDLDGPHAALVVGKRGYGKSYTLGVLAEAAAATPGVAPVVVDPMGVLGGLADGAVGGDEWVGGGRETSGDGGPRRREARATGIDGTVVTDPRVRADALPPDAWPRLLGLDPTEPAGALVWGVASEAGTLAGMRRLVAEGGRSEGGVGGEEDRGTVATGAPDGVRRAAANHLRLAARWDVFDPDGLTPAALATGGATVLDCSGLDAAPANALVRAVARGLYGARTSAGGTFGDVDRLPWLFVDEAHAYFGGVAGPALRTLLTRGRAPGVSLVAATQRPGALPAVAVSQSDLLVAHRLTAEADVEALTAATPTYLRGTIRERLPGGVGEALVVDDATESVHEVRVRERVTPHEGASPRASDVV